MKYICTILIAVCSIVSCMSDSAKILYDVESYISQRPDSALRIISMVDKNALRGDRAKAHYSLLYSIALDKNYIDVTSDSLILPAVDYYRYNGTSRHKMHMWYQYGRVLYNAHQYSSAVISFMKAADIAEHIDDYLVIGLANRGIAESYANTYNLHEALKFLMTAYDNFVLADAPQYAQYALLSQAKAYVTLDKFDEGRHIYDKLMKDAYYRRDTTMMKLCIDGYVSLFSADPSQDYQRVIACSDFMSDSLHACVSPDLLGEVAVAYLYSGDVEKSSLYERLASMTCRDTIVTMYNDYRIAQATGHYERALHALEGAALRYDRINRFALEQSVSSMQRDYFRQQSEFESFRSFTKTVVLICSLFIFCFLLVFIVVGFRRRFRRKERDIMLLMSQIHELSIEKDTAINDFSNRIQNLYETKLKFIDSVCDKYYSYNGSMRNKFVMKEIENMITAVSEDSEILTLESIINAFNDNVMQHVRDTFPRLKLKDIRFLCYWYAGFSTWTMSLLLNERVENIYNRKSRFRKKFEESDSEYRQLFLRNLV